VSPCGPSGPCGRGTNIETPTEITLAANTAITMPAMNFPIEKETAAIFLTFVLSVSSRYLTNLRNSDSDVEYTFYLEHDLRLELAQEG
jgi:hypothetical protein